MIAQHLCQSAFQAYALTSALRGGIVRCAHSIIVLITKFWPYTIDILPEEKGIVDGIKPAFFTGWDQDNV